MGCFLVGLLFFFCVLLFGVDPILGGISFVVLIGVSIYLAISDNQKQKELQDNKTNKLKDLINKLENFKITNEIISYDLDTALLLDEKNNKIAIIRSEGEYVRSYDYNELLESEIFEDGVTVSKTSRSSQMGGALLGGVLAGGVGAIIGGLSGSSTSSQEVNSIDMEIVVNDTKEPIFVINFAKADVLDFNGKPIPMKKDDEKYKEGIRNANYWHSLISVLIKKADEIDKEKEKNEAITQQQKYSVADELKKLKDLYNEGILSADEFESQKKKILS
ncbi:SHOCT domain-containing protein [Halalkalibacter sp. APA_J-10(15)]|uniref:SHOCT domain-containing protein n=1 Tax=Halalkalibacter sp. APA_J-10(15) TaxID=2933805 RepID=UPI001FF1C1E0|nr:SHOCT domain-containing protein [Halalkalibacter sp. APA_J-10(15)]MCK0470898.1 SHOCT domain-containing protein [Halalkalibacter sp. APA_J-10(15)]